MIDDLAQCRDRRICAGSGKRSAFARILDVAIVEGMGILATRATTAEEFAEQLEKTLATPGPVLIEAMIPGIG